ncbi:MAG: hypothetical protein ACM34K_12575 [Bacillota bacterium]
MAKKLTEREIFDHVFNKTKLDEKKLKLLEEDLEYKELREYYETLKKQIEGKTEDDILEIAKKIRKRIGPKE